jgi:outer membrane immunogenic protein
MKRIAIAAAALVSLATSAFAADMSMPVKAPIYKAPPPCTWCGWYVGLNAGWTGTDAGAGGLGSVLAVGAIPASVGNRTSGFIGGGQIGYNWQTGNWVAGLEADFDGVSAKATTTVIFPGGLGFVPLTTTYTHQLDWLSTVRGRLGALVAPNLLLYVTGGLAVGEVKTGSAFLCPTCAPASATEATTNLTSSSTRAGGTVGAGFEWMIAPHWSVKAEYLYATLGNTSNTITYNYGAGNAIASTLTSTVHNNYNIARAGLNWHF